MAAEDFQEYSIKFKFDKSYEKFKNISKTMQTFNSQQSKARTLYNKQLQSTNSLLDRQIQKQRQLNKLGGGTGRTTPTKKPSSPRIPVTNIDRAHDQALAERDRRTNNINKAHGQAIAENAKRQQSYDNAHSQALAEEVRRREKAHNQVLTERRRRLQSIEAAHNQAIAENARRQQVIDNQHGQALAEAGRRQAVIDRAHGQAIAEQNRRQQAGDNIHSQALAENLRRTRVIERAEANRVRSLEAARAQVRRTSFYQREGADAIHEQARAALMVAMNSARTADEVRNAAAAARNQVSNARRTTQEFRQQNFLLQRMNTSSRQMIGNYIGVFGLAAGGANVVRTGQDFEAIGNTFTAVSDSPEEAAANLKFVRDESYRLGLSYKSTAKEYAKMFAAKGTTSTEDVRELFSSFSEASTVLGLSGEQGERGLKAFTQMMSKGKITREEMQEQLGDVLPGAVEMFAQAAKDAGVSVSGSLPELYKLGEQGKLLSAEILPHLGKALRAKYSGGLEGAMNSNRVAMQRMIMVAQEAAVVMFDGGLSEGLTEFFHSIRIFIEENMYMWESLGTVIGGVFKSLAFVIRALTPAFKAFGKVLNEVTDTLGDFSVILVALLFRGQIAALWRMAAAFGAVASSATSAAAASTALNIANTAGTGAAASRMAIASRAGIVGLAGLGVYEAHNMLQSKSAEVINSTDTGTRMNRAVASQIFNETKVVVELDGQQVGSAVVNSQEFENGVDGRISHHTN